MEQLENTKLPLIITHYEEEIYKDKAPSKKFFELNECNNYTELMQKFIRDGSFKNKQGKLLSIPPYFDPDGEELKHCSYYWELTQFLNQREEELKKKLGGNYKYVYVAPLDCKKDRTLEEIAQFKETDKDKDMDENQKRKQISVFRNDNLNKPILYLKSDQLGFSVKGFDQHPYGIGSNMAKQLENQEKRENIYTNIAECIYETRTLGGGFLWPLDIYGSYNKGRGGSEKKGSYIEDRADLTLLEIKHLFEWLCENDEQKKNEIWNKYADYIIFSNKIKKDFQKNSAYIEWLKHFGSFEDYIKFFCFDDFMMNDKERNVIPFPLDIVESELKLSDDGMSVIENGKIPLEDSTKYKNRKENSIYNLTESEMLKMLNNIKVLVMARSQRMQAKVKQYRQGSTLQ